MYRTSYLTLCLVAVSLLTPVATQAQSKSGQAPGVAQRLTGPTAPDEQHRKAADAILQQIWGAQPGQPKFDAINAVVQKYKDSDEATRNAIAWLCLTYMKDQSRGVLDRWPCEYVLSWAGYEPAVPDLIDVLLHDPVEAMRAVAAEALGCWWNSTADPAVYDALLQASKADASQQVRDTIARYLGKSPTKPGPGDPDEAHRRLADSILQPIWNASPGQSKFNAIDEVVRRFRQSDAATQTAIAWLCLTYMKQPSRAPLDRWPCEYVLSRAGYEPAVPELIDVLFHDPLECMRAVAAEALGEWWKGTGNPTMRDALAQAGQTDTSKWVRETVERYLGKLPTTPDPSAPDEAHRKAADAILQQIWKAQPGQPKFDAIDAVVRKYKESDSQTQYAIAWLCLAYMKDQSRGPLDRWPCEYVLSRAAYEPAVPHLCDVLLHDQTECMRSVAAEALGGWWKSTGNATMYDALLQASQTDTSKWVRETIARYLGNNKPTQQGGRSH